MVEFETTIEGIQCDYDVTIGFEFEESEPSNGINECIRVHSVYDGRNDREMWIGIERGEYADEGITMDGILSLCRDHMETKKEEYEIERGGFDA